MYSQDPVRRPRNTIDLLVNALNQDPGRPLPHLPDGRTSTPVWGEAVKALVVLRPGRRELTILRLSAELGSDAEWGRHFKIATRAEVYGRVCLALAVPMDEGILPISAVDSLT